MSIDLTPGEQVLRDSIKEKINKVKHAFAEYRSDKEVGQWIREAGTEAHQLHMALRGRGYEPVHHGYMRKNRGVPPDSPEFYMHFHPIVDLLKFLEDEHANDDPVDSTIDVEFTFRVFANRWGHHDVYSLKRTQYGWYISHIGINGDSDKSGRPVLFANLDHDSVQYPIGLGDRLEWLWMMAAEKGMTAVEVQKALQQLADWVSLTEQNTPSDGVWEGS
jgi:hypothetical protein